MPTPRRKQPQEVRARLLKATAAVAAEQGLEAVTIAEVSKRAGVTSGGLFHHFHTKQDLIDELFSVCMNAFESKIEELISRDPDPRGRFARAYLLAAHCDYGGLCDDAQMGNILMSMSRDSKASLRWVGWLAAQQAKHGPEKDPVLGDIIRYAADGLWLEEYTMESLDQPRRRAVIERLTELSRLL